MIRIETKDTSLAHALSGILKHEKIEYTKGFGPQGLIVYDIDVSEAQYRELIGAWANATYALQLGCFR